MKVLFDHQIFQIQRVGGISKGLCELITYFPPELDYEICLKESDNVYLKEFGINVNYNNLSYSYRDFLPNVNFRGKGKLFEYLSRKHFINSSDSINQKHSLDVIRQGNFDVFHPTYFDTYYLNKITKPLVLTVHDLTIERIFGHKAKYDFQVVGRRKLLSRTDAIIVPSKYTKDDLIELYDIDPHKINVVYWGSPSRQFVHYKNLYSFDYVLFVGQRQGYKNFGKMLNESQRFFQKNKDIHLVCTGHEFTKLEKENLQSCGILKRSHTILASEEEMKSLYQNAVVFVFPSDSEGFGLPILEAFSNGCPVIVSEKTCFPEIAGNAALYINENGEETNLSQLLDKCLNFSEEERENLRHRGYNRLKEFSWEEAARRYFDVYNAIL